MERVAFVLEHDRVPCLDGDISRFISFIGTGNDSGWREVGVQDPAAYLSAVSDRDIGYVIYWSSILHLKIPDGPGNN